MDDIYEGLFLPTTQVWDVDEIYGTDVNSREFKELIIRLYQQLNLVALTVNAKESALYETSEFVTGQTFFPDVVDSTAEGEASRRPVFRKVINFGVLPNTAAKNVAHGITFTPGAKFTRIYGVATDPTYGALVALPLPYASPTLVNNIELNVNNANITVTTGSNRTAYTVCYVVVEYISA